MANTNQASALPNDACMPKSQKHTFQGLLCDRLLKKYGVIETARDIARQYFDKQSLGGGANDVTSTEGIHGKMAFFKRVAASCMPMCGSSA